MIVALGKRRFNNRQNLYLFRDTMRVLIQSGNLPYADLTAP